MAAGWGRPCRRRLSGGNHSHLAKIGDAPSRVRDPGRRVVLCVVVRGGQAASGAVAGGRNAPVRRGVIGGALYGRRRGSDDYRRDGLPDRGGHATAYQLYSAASLNTRGFM